MLTDLLDPAPHLPPADALHLSQQAPRVLQTTVDTSLPYPLSLLISSETQETWLAHENLLLACLRTGDDKSARLCLDRLTARFGETNEKIVALKGMYEEALANNNNDLEKILKSYENTLKDDPTNLCISKRRVALLKSLSRLPEATEGLVGLLDASPSDVAAWAELSDLYFKQGLYSQAIYAMEEVLLITPNAWNMQARLGELIYASIKSNSKTNEGVSLRGTAESMRRFCRSIELCDDYLRGYHGLWITSSHLGELLERSPKIPSVSNDSPFADTSVPELSTVQRLKELATAKLGEIVRRSKAGDPGWDSIDESDIAAARNLLEQSSSNVSR